MKTVISHFYNEEYMLPWWLNHHKQYFDHGILIDYGSNDKSLEIIKKICPTWEVVRTENEYFSSKKCDEEIMRYERKLSGWKIVLNITEFLHGNYSLLNDCYMNKEYYIPSFVMVDDKDNNYPDENIPLHKQLFNGIHYLDSFNNLTSRHLRCLHNHQVNYPLGRHYSPTSYPVNEDFIIFHYGYAPMNEKTLKRKLQIQFKIPKEDIQNNIAAQHYRSFDLTENTLKKEDLTLRWKHIYFPLTKNLNQEMEKFV
jgi:hypothetical protein